MRPKFSLLLLIINYSLLINKSIAQPNTTYRFTIGPLTLDYTGTGAMLTGVKSKELPQNPLTWKLTKEQMPPNNQKGEPFAGHFLCLGRWGSPSEAEKKAGIPHNGNINNLPWKFKPSGDTPKDSVVMTVTDTLEHLSVRRVVRPTADGKGVSIREEFTNLLPLDRTFTAVQHATIGPPFLTDSVQIFTNAGWGFDQAADFATLDKTAFRFPNGQLKSGPARLDRVSDPRGYVTSHIHDDTTKIGYVAAYNPQTGALLIYTYRTSVYKWVNLWHYKENGKQVAYGLEFGTTGFGKSLRESLTDKLNFKGETGIKHWGGGDRVVKGYRVYYLTSKSADVQKAIKEVVGGI